MGILFRDQAKVKIDVRRLQSILRRSFASLPSISGGSVQEGMVVAMPDPSTAFTKGVGWQSPYLPSPSPSFDLIIPVVASFSKCLFGTSLIFKVG
jgi:hypothetical protein